MTGRIFFPKLFYDADRKSLMDNDSLQEMAAEVPRVAIQDQPLSYGEVVTEYEDEPCYPCYLWNENLILSTKIRRGVLFE